MQSIGVAESSRAYLRLIVVSLTFIASLLLSCSTELFAQASSAYHVFPQFVDGTLQGGTFYRSTLFATNATSANASCQYQLYGMSNERLSSTNSFVLPANGGVIRASTAGTSGFASGYATLNCSGPVLSYLQYEYLSPAGDVLGTASVYSAPPATAQEFILPTAAGYRLGLAIANDSDTTAQITLRLGAAGNNEVQTTISIGPRSKISRFIDELFSIPNGFVPVAVLMQSVGSDPTPFTAVGLSFSGSAFSTTPPLIFQQ